MNINDLFSDDLADAGKRLWERRRRQVIESKKTKGLTRDIDEGVMSDLDQDLQDVRWDEIVSAVQLAVKTGQNAEEIVKRMSKKSGLNLQTINQELIDRGFTDISDLEDYIQSHGGKYTPPKSFHIKQAIDKDQQLDEIIRKVGDDKYRLYSKKGKNLGTFDSRAGAEKHEREVQYFKHMGESDVTEDVGGNYLYHATDEIGLKGILSSGIIRAADAPQTATKAQTKLPSVSFTRNFNYAIGGKNAAVMGVGGKIGRDAVLVFGRESIENNFKTIGTSQSQDVRGLPHATKQQIGKIKFNKTMIDDPTLDPEIKQELKQRYSSPKSGGEFEEAIVVPKGGLPIKNKLVGFYVNPKSILINDSEIMNDPRRLEQIGPNRFAKANDNSTSLSSREKISPKTQQVTAQEISECLKEMREAGYGV